MRQQVLQVQVDPEGLIERGQERRGQLTHAFADALDRH
jgi:hypothetical protein